MRIKGNTFVVTGGASGMGEATVHELVRLGANVAIINPENPDAALNLADLEDVLRVNVIGTLNVCKQVANVLAGQEPYNKDGRFDARFLCLDCSSPTTRSSAYSLISTIPGERGVLINTTSIAWDDGQVGQVAYAAAKGGIYSVSLPMARDLAPYGVRVMAIAPGCFQTPMVAAAKELPNFTLAEMAAASSGLMFPKRFGQAPEFAQLVVQIVENVMLNGSVIRLDGGVRLK
ncbi:short-chain dehydrogenase/reductase SDR [Jimgerdemannia flammicorona]|uniref:Short-chain dehydrogenase/reductase SDR n=1 Tax=Jimgerdemannia flammicorona TaxID=994334 RepID=A0A433QDL6_9FUNG|nr:short-chain dehydrogenase/reductase SDR [Jimgerdemannia flammicorona]